MFGRQVNLPIHFLAGNVPHRNLTSQTYNSYVVTLEEKMTKVYRFVRSKLKANAERQKQNYDTRISTNNYKVGDIVYCLDTTRKVGLSPKLKRHVWKGPMVVLRKISDLLFEVKGAPRALTKILHHDRLKAFHGESIPQWIVSVQQSLKSDSTTQTQTRNPVTVRKKTSIIAPKQHIGDVDLQGRRSKRQRNQPQRLGIQ